MTLADLVTLVAGFALSWEIPWFGFQPTQVPWFQARPDRTWLYTVSATLTEGAERLGVVLAIVALARRIRFGGLARPAELLLVFVAMHLLMVPRGGSMWVLGSRTSAGMAIGSMVLAASALAIGLGRKRLPGWSLTILVAVAFLTLTNVFQGLAELAVRRTYQFRLSLAGQFACELPVAIPSIMLVAMPFAAALADANRARRGWTLLEWGGAILAIAWFSCEQVHYLTGALSSDPSWYFLAGLGVGSLMLAVAVVLEVRLAKKLAPGLGRWLARG